MSGDSGPFNLISMPASPPPRTLNAKITIAVPQAPRCCASIGRQSAPDANSVHTIYLPDCTFAPSFVHVCNYVRPVHCMCAPQRSPPHKSTVARPKQIRLRLSCQIQSNRLIATNDWLGHGPWRPMGTQRVVRSACRVTATLPQNKLQYDLNEQRFITSGLWWHRCA